MYYRVLKEIIEKRFFKGKIIILYGARRVGKTTLIQSICDNYRDKDITSLKIQGDVARDRNQIINKTPCEIIKIMGSAKILFIDEIQAISNAGVILKTLVDEVGPSIQIIATGSAALDVAGTVKEPMTGRYYEFIMYPLTIAELQSTPDIQQHTQRLHFQQEERVRFGWYPEVLSMGDSDASEYLLNLYDSYVYKDILMLGSIKKPEALNKILSYLAYCIGSTITMQGIAQDTGIAHQTAEHYLDILEKIFVVKKLKCFSKNSNNTLKKAFKIYFIDVGILNAVLNNFSHRLDRPRKAFGALFENYIVSERIKHLHYHSPRTNIYFWRNYQKQEVDIIETIDDSIHAIECKIHKDTTAKGLKAFKKLYPHAITHTAHWDTYSGLFEQQTQQQD